MHASRELKNFGNLLSANKPNLIHRFFGSDLHQMSTALQQECKDMLPRESA